MKATYWNGDATITKGCGSSDSEYFFSVGDLVAFRVNSFSSPDGRSFGHGCIPKQENYLLQEEILLEEFDNSTFPGEPGHGPVGGMDRKTIEEIVNVFWHKYSRPVISRTFLLGVLDTSENVFSGGFIHGEISEVRNHSGKFLHIYEIPEEYRECKGETFESTVAAINLQKKQEDEYQADLAAKNWRGVELVFGITASGWYESEASFGRHSVQRAHEYDSTSRSHYNLMIMPCVPNGGTRGNKNSWSCRPIHFYLPNGMPVSLSLYTDKNPEIDTITDHRWNNQQSWWYVQIETIEIQPGWIFVDGEDVFYCTKKIIEENRAKKITTRNAKFAEAKAKAFEAGITETQIGQIIKLADKGQIINTLKLVTTMVAKYSPVFILEIFNYIPSENPEVIENYAYLVAHAGEIKLANVKLATKNAYARSYINNLIPGYITGGHFDFYMRALSLALANKVSFKNGNNETFGGENCESDLAVKLREAGLTKIEE